MKVLKTRGKSFAGQMFVFTGSHGLRGPLSMGIRLMEFQKNLIGFMTH